jgi:uncharacterized protein YbaP (TraB family)
MLRRELLSLLLSLPLVARAASRHSEGSNSPPFWRASRGKASVFLLGFSEARDKSWFTPTIQEAFNKSSELWLETAPYPDFQDAVAKQAAAELAQRNGEASGSTFFDALEPAVRERALQYVADLDIKRESIEGQRPWLGYYTINSAFWSKTKQPYKLVYADEVLRELATTKGKTIQYELPTSETFVRLMAGMPERAQSQYIGWLLDFFDENKNGLSDESFDWTVGKPTTAARSLERMQGMPDLYRVIQVERNAWWARKISELLETDRIYFVAVGMLHVLGPDGIPRELERLAVPLERS